MIEGAAACHRGVQVLTAGWTARRNAHIVGVTVSVRLHTIFTRVSAGMASNNLGEHVSPLSFFFVIRARRLFALRHFFLQLPKYRR